MKRFIVVLLCVLCFCGWALAGGRKSRIQELEERIEHLEKYQEYQEFVIENWADTVEERFELLGL